MPSATFLALPDDKRARFVEAAVDTFASQPYDQASISQLVARLGIAKGSVYQYFDDKFGLFSWLVEEGGRRRARVMAALPDDAGPFEQLRLAYRAGLRAWRAEPAWSRLGLRTLEPSVEPRLAALRTSLDRQTLDFLTGWLQAGQARGHVRADLPLPSTARFVQGVLQDGLLRAFLDALDTDLDGFVARAPALTDAELEAALGVADEAIAFLEATLAPRRG
ncbi:MAG: TetR/AcrR family transcriptional regulator [Alphaproteobacteria bacterium]|nr:TetR/AcrR family transcriptional regulator [Alphaproteobacteria bacterium]